MSRANAVRSPEAWRGQFSKTLAQFTDPCGFISNRFLLAAIYERSVSNIESNFGVDSVLTTICSQSEHCGTAIGIRIQTKPGKEQLLATTVAGITYRKKCNASWRESHAASRHRLT